MSGTLISFYKTVNMTHNNVLTEPVTVRSNWKLATRVTLVGVICKTVNKAGKPKESRVRHNSVYLNLTLPFTGSRFIDRHLDSFFVVGNNNRSQTAVLCMNLRGK